MIVTLHTTFASIGRETWERIVSQSSAATLFQGWSWNEGWWRAQGESGPRRLFLLSADDEQGPRAIAPLMLETEGKIRVLKFLGDGHALESDLIYADNDTASCRRLINHLGDHADQWDEARLSSIPAHSPTIAVIDAWASSGDASVEWGRHRALPAPLPDAEPSPDAQSIESLFVQQIHRWSAHEPPSLFAERTNRDFYRGLIEGANPRDQARLRRLIPELDGRRSETAGPSARYVVSAFIRKGKQGPVQRLRRAVSDSRPIRAIRALTGEARRVGHIARGAGRIVEHRRATARERASHREFYESVIPIYSRDVRLQKPEMLILAQLRGELPRMRVLDVGVGAGRTAIYFGTLAAHYRAFDYAPKMVAAAQQNLGDLLDPDWFTCDDAREMKGVADQSCDFVLISYNGIDSVGPEADRQRVLSEVRRVAVPGGYFCFSSHNLKSLTPGGARGAVARLTRLRRYLLLRAANPGLKEIRKQGTAMVCDVATEFAIPHYYIAPSAQVKQLEAHGFKEIRVFSVNTGQEVTDPSRWDALIDSWVYYLCRT